MRKSNTATIFKIMVWLLSNLANRAYRDELIGDLQEEYNARKEAKANTVAWLLHQTIVAICDGQKAFIKSATCAKLIGFALCLIGLPMIALFVVWLSNMGEVSDTLWQLVLAGEIHQIVANTEYWTQAWYKTSHYLHVSMFFNIPSILWAVLFLCVAIRLLKNANTTIWVFSIAALLYILLPYGFGYMLINTFSPAAKKVGPILAFMMLAPFYTLPLYVMFLFTRFKNIRK